MFQLIAVGLASFFVAALLSAMGYSYCYHLNRTTSESAVIHPSTPNHLNYNKPGNAAPKNEKYIPMEFKVGSTQCFIYCRKREEWIRLRVYPDMKSEYRTLLT